MNQENNAQWVNTTELFGEILVELADKDPRVVFVGADTCIGSGTEDFLKKFPERTYDVGIAEQNACGFAAGLAFAGKKPFYSSIANFLVFRCYEQIRDDIAKPNLNVVLVGRGAGMSYSTSGPTHNTFDDIGSLRVMPGLTIIDPGDSIDFRNSIIKSIEVKGPVYIRSNKQLIRCIRDKGYRFKIGRGEIIKEGKNVVFISCGTMVYQSLLAINILRTQGIDAGLINIHTIKPIDKNLIKEVASNYSNIIVVEEHSIINGLGSAVSDILSDSNYNKLLKIGFNDEFPIICGPYMDVLEFYGLTGEKIAEKAKKFIRISKNRSGKNK